jgi:hypothetical protein
MQQNSGKYTTARYVPNSSIYQNTRQVSTARTSPTAGPTGPWDHRDTQEPLETLPHTHILSLHTASSTETCLSASLTSALKTSAADKEETCAQGVLHPSLGVTDLRAGFS